MSGHKVQIYSKYFRKWEAVKNDPNGATIPANLHNKTNDGQTGNWESAQKLHNKLHFRGTEVLDRQQVID